MLLERFDPDVEMIEAGSVSEALDLLGTRPVSVVILELSLCGDECSETVCAVVEHAKVPVLVFSKYAYDDRVIAALQAGACGYVNETDDVGAFVTMLRKAAAGEYVLDAELVKEVVQRMRLLAARPARVHASEHIALTGREHEILRLVCEGRTNGQIGSALGIAENTVKNHMQTIFRRLNVCSRSQAASVAIERGLLLGHSPHGRRSDVTE